MKITVFGATGRTGLHLVDQALARGHAVTVFVRSPAKLGAMRSRVTVMQGDLQGQEQVAQAIAGAKAVVSVLGPTNNEGAGAHADRCTSQRRNSGRLGWQRQRSAPQPGRFGRFHARPTRIGKLLPSSSGNQQLIWQPGGLRLPPAG
jgi:NAD(P)-dependent dehydrogenase (short-subunit alcohol dehydrogenase family)